MSSSNEIEELKALILENQRLLTETNLIVKKMKRVAVWDFGIRIFLMALFLGLPFLAYYYVVGPYFDTLLEAFHTLQEMSKVPGLEAMLQQSTANNGN
jgi:hypothetical protein